MMEVLIDRQVIDTQPMLLFQFKDYILNQSYQRMLQNLIENRPPKAETMNYLNEDGFTPMLEFIKHFKLTKNTVELKIEKALDKHLADFGRLQDFKMLNSDLFEGGVPS